MHFNTLIALATLAPIFGAQAGPIDVRVASNSPPPNGKLLQRQEWRSMSKAAQLNYIKAVQCLHTKPAAKNILNAKVLSDSFTAAHVTLATDPKLGDTIHVVGQFLPWHRWFVSVHETNLRALCNYQGAQPYWDWTLDSGKMLKSPVFDPIYGFGGNGVHPKKIVYPYNETIGFVPPGPGNLTPIGACIPNGPFSQYTLNVGPGQFTAPHCLARNITDSQAASISKAFVDSCLAKTNYIDFWICTELGIGGPPGSDELNGPHAGAHISVGEDMGNMISSPNDPLFMLHHAQIDRMWTTWQNADKKNRMFQIGGNSTQAPPFHDVTLDYVLKMVGLGPDVPIRYIMNATALGYEYI